MSQWFDSIENCVQKKKENCSGRSRVRRILVTCIQLLLLQFLHVIWSMPTNFAVFKQPLDKFFQNFFLSETFPMKTSIICMRINFLNNGFALSLALKQRLGATWKIGLLLQLLSNQNQGIQVVRAHGFRHSSCKLLARLFS